MLARFRLAAARRPGDPEFTALIEHLHRHSAEARSWWSRQEVLLPASGTKRLRHPALGEITFSHVVLQVADDPDLKLVTFSPADGNQEPLAQVAATIRLASGPAAQVAQEVSRDRRVEVLHAHAVQRLWRGEDHPRRAVVPGCDQVRSGDQLPVPVISTSSR
jgi:hypothetical protein